MIKALTSADFDSETSSGVAIVDFWATWCGPCRMMAPVIDEIAEEYADSVKTCKVDVDQAQDVAIKFGIMSIPTIFVMKNGEVVSQFVGVTSKDAIVAALRKAIGIA